MLIADSIDIQLLHPPCLNALYLPGVSLSVTMPIVSKCRALHLYDSNTNSLMVSLKVQLDIERSQ